MLGGGGGGNVLFMVSRADESKYKKWIQATQKLYDEWASDEFKEEDVRATLIEPCIDAGSTLLF